MPKPTISVATYLPGGRRALGLVRRNAWQYAAKSLKHLQTNLSIKIGCNDETLPRPASQRDVKHLDETPM